MPIKSIGISHKTTSTKKPKPCHCDGYWFPHRLSSGKCKYDKHNKSKWQSLEETPEPIETINLYPF